jgi:HAD superfamily hydrolase (TIGR01509 family)
VHDAPPAAPALALPPGDFAAYIFDCDGTLADTMPTHYRAWCTALGEHAQSFPEAMFYELGGVPTSRIVELLNERHGFTIPVEETVARKEAIFLELSPQIAAIEPVVALAKQFFGKKPLAVASGGHRRIVLNTLRALGIVDLFQAIVTAEDYQRGKPAPDPFLEAALRLNVPPEQCLVFEDTATGIAAATAAGMQSVLVPPPPRRNTAEEVQPRIFTEEMGTG